MDFTIATRGLPDGTGRVEPALPYEFEFTWYSGRPGWILTIPRHQTGKSEFSPDFPEQDAWLGRVAARAPWLQEVYYVTWRMADWRRLAKLLEPTRVTPPPQRALAASLVYAYDDDGRRRSLQLCRQFRDDPHVHLCRAKGLVRQERWRPALRALGKIAERWPELSEGHALLCEVLGRRGRIARGIEAGWKAVELNPEHTPSLMHLLVERQRTAPAAESLAAWERLAALNAAAGLQPISYIHANMASCRWALGDVEG